MAALALGTLMAVLLTLSGAERGFRVFCAVPWALGGTAVGAAAEGLCVILHMFRARQMRPWELFEEGEVDLELAKKSLDGMSITTSGVSVTPSFGDAKWVGRYRERGLWRRVFETSVAVGDPAVREVQDTLVLQALLIGVLGSAVATGIFVALPKGNFF